MIAMLLKMWYMLLYAILTAIFRGRPPPQPQPQSVACLQSMVEDTLDLHGVYSRSEWEQRRGDSNRQVIRAR